jgi:hypothetical protein
MDSIWKKVSALSYRRPRVKRKGWKTRKVRVFEISKEHFGYLPIDPPKDILSKIPSELPPFLDNTPASRELRELCEAVQAKDERVY